MTKHVSNTGVLGDTNLSAFSMKNQGSTGCGGRREENLNDSGVLESSSTTHISAGMSSFLIWITSWAEISTGFPEQDGNEADDELDDDSLFEDFELTPEILDGLNKIEHDEVVASVFLLPLLNWPGKLTTG